MTGGLNEAYSLEDFRLQKSAVPPRGEAWDMRWSWVKAAQSNGNHNIGSGGRGIQQMAQGRTDHADPDHVENNWQWDGPEGPGNKDINDGGSNAEDDNILFPHPIDGTQINSQIIFNRFHYVDENACGNEDVSNKYPSLDKDIDPCSFPSENLFSSTPIHYGVAPSARGCHM
ncbi:MAG: hypothetical protein ACPGR8_10870 [Limisphaerales bacterium]